MARELHGFIGVLLYGFMNLRSYGFIAVWLCDCDVQYSDNREAYDSFRVSLIPAKANVNLAARVQLSSDVRKTKLAFRNPAFSGASRLPESARGR